jgi:hypothetical protein
MTIHNKLVNKKHYPTLMRFMDLTKLLDFLISGTFHFTRLDQFEDKSEGISRKQLAKFFDHDISITAERKRELPLIDRQKRYFATCWFSGIRESVGMWNLYSNSSSIALKIPIKTFLNIWEESNLSFLPSNNWIDRIYINQVFYKDYFSPKAVDNFKEETKIIGFQKDVCYEHEKEVRVLIKVKGQLEEKAGKVLYKENPLPFVKTKISSIIKIKMQILFHPLMPNWQKTNIKNLIAIHGYKNITCADSEVTRLLKTIPN